LQDSEKQDVCIPVSKYLSAAILSLLLIKVFLASVLDLYSDEVFYWQASANPAIAYSDLPFMTALLIGLGSTIEPSNTLAARSLFILLGSCLPLLVFWLAKPITGHKYAIESATLSLCLPLAGFLGLLAVPDVPLVFFGLLSIGFFDRALRDNKLSHWLFAGTFVAMGLSTHYRFFLYPAGAILFLLFFSGERKQWSNPRLWLCISIASLGLIPILWFNLSNALSSASFYFVDRHPWEFQASGLLHMFKQAGLVTPPLYLIFACTLFLMLGKARHGDRSAALLLSFSGVNLLIYLLLAPWTDATSTSIHWPLSGYFPLMVFVPLALRSASSFLARYFTPRRAHRLILCIPIIGFLGTLSALFGVGSQAFQTSLQPIVGSGVLSNKMAGWKPFATHVDELLQSQFSKPTLIITDNYYTLAQVEYAKLSKRAYTLDEDKAVRDGRITQYRLWQKDRIGFEMLSADDYLFVAEDSTLDTATKHDLLEYLCGRAAQVEHLGTLHLFAGDKAFSFYKGSALDPDSNQSSACPYPAIAWMDAPARDAEIHGVMAINGWAFNEDIGIERITVLIDGEPIADVEYGGSRPDVVEVMQVENGRHQVELEIRNRLGVLQRYGKRTVEIKN
jgi:hypothetical protein